MLHRMLGVSVLAALIGTPAIAQVMEDSTVGTMVSGTGPYTVTGGTTQLTTLFHSFAEFSPNTNAVTFALDGSQSTIDVVIGRVTGSNSSLIDGQLTLTGGNTPDLFLLNPNGITFGQNASLLLPGSFLATTAKSVEFNNNQSFSTNNPGSAPMLTISTPMGLQFGASAAPLQINNANLAVNAVQNLSFVGGDVTVAGGSLSAPGGRLQIAGIDSNNRLDLDADGAFDTDGLAIRGAGGFRDLVIDQGANLSVNDQGFVTL
ncbi:MAG: filamentous hemagglutinin N-terminal domain-containing protein, partial [Cyanobacteria bacterium J06642_11]